MSKHPPSSQSLHEGSNYRSPFAKVLGLGYYDGPTSGLLQCGQDDEVYKFDLLEELGNSDGLDLRIFGLAPVPSTALAQLADAYAKYWTPHWPLWVPIWRFPTPGDQKAMEELTDQVLHQAGPTEWVIATHDLVGEVVVAKPVTSEQVSQITDWPSFLGFANESTLKK